MQIEYDLTYIQQISAKINELTNELTAESRAPVDTIGKGPFMEGLRQIYDITCDIKAELNRVLFDTEVFVRTASAEMENADKSIAGMIKKQESYDKRFYR